MHVDFVPATFTCRDLRKLELLTTLRVGPESHGYYVRNGSNFSQPYPLTSFKAPRCNAAGGTAIMTARSLTSVRLMRIGAVRPVPWRRRPEYAQVRRLHLNPILTPPLVFCGLLVALWTWKCTMLVVFQNKIIYTPGLPPNARRETIANYESECYGIKWREERIRAVDNTSLALCVAEVRAGEDGGESQTPTGARRIPVYILYFQGWTSPSTFRHVTSTHIFR